MKARIIICDGQLRPLRLILFVCSLDLIASSNINYKHIFMYVYNYLTPKEKKEEKML